MKVVKYGGSLFVKIPKGSELKKGDEVILSRDMIQTEIKKLIKEYNKDIEDQIEFRKLLKKYIQGEQTAREQITEAINKINYMEDKLTKLENKLKVEDTYRNERIEIQKFYEDYLLTKNVFYKWKKELKQ